MSQTQTAENTASEDVLSNIGNDEPDELEADDIYHLLQNERRRSVLRYMKDVEGPARMRDVAEQVAAWEYDTTVEELTSQERQRVYIALYQAHLPKLDKNGVIDYNQSRGIVEQRPRAERLEQYLVEDDVTAAGDEPQTGAGDDRRTDPDAEPNAAGDGSPTVDGHARSTHYFAAMAGAGALLVGSAVGAPVLDALTPVAIGTLLVVAFAALAIWQRAEIPSRNE